MLRSQPSSRFRRCSAVQLHGQDSHALAEFEGTALGQRATERPPIGVGQQTRDLGLLMKFNSVGHHPDDEPLAVLLQPGEGRIDPPPVPRRVLPALPSFDTLVADVQGGRERVFGEAECLSARLQFDGVHRATS